MPQQQSGKVPQCVSYARLKVSQVNRQHDRTARVPDKDPSWAGRSHRRECPSNLAAGRAQGKAEPG
jgi:hypothetical protein